MKRAIIPLVTAVAVLIVFMTVNKQLTAAGYVLSLGIGYGIGAVINNLVFRKSNQASDSDQTTAESMTEEVS